LWAWTPVALRGDMLEKFCKTEHMILKMSTLVNVDKNLGKNLKVLILKTKLRRELHDTVAKPKDRHYIKFEND
jgi:hypothetical protein